MMYDFGEARENDVIRMDRNVTGLIQTGIRGVGRLFYIVDPWETTFEKPEDVPNYITQTVPYFALGIILEEMIRWKQGRRLIRVDDGIVSLAGGLLLEITRFVMPLSNEDRRSAVISLHEAGKSPTEIFRLLQNNGYNRNFIKRTIQRFLETNSTEDRHRSGRP
ncbi:unnamed protein product, partial [Darwinula stevensoni]